MCHLESWLRMSEVLPPPPERGLEIMQNRAPPGFNRQHKGQLSDSMMAALSLRRMYAGAIQEGP
ncbi:hypothetical protein DSLASN_47950 [Desulfoluna limicola]|uniref:Uncharacterized protein n=1 Tax=Desulfoluna limicola TaxID=2810562 RepID=A0ABM7PPF9_9BACT|nr:hypothetical protein DSLASN_47950 [Desulfoluna limicola]